ncbi:hypothetical protein ASNO1_37290 [Corallococcus caeni]|uniref:Uncharacterized protein n=1 Tax=Corallococcus caeni TaxID=3082388 RepID=A0ABQ6QUI6_9BACT|nr:hypothetical protein ASNO1_37290 [Corallococcus sp. NO1]
MGTSPARHLPPVRLVPYTTPVNPLGQRAWRGRVADADWRHTAHFLTDSLWAAPERPSISTGMR